ncbi:DUF6346 domain-containing protein [Micromonospora sp. NPDC048999]|uniref:DUF6346 domain-containing protein n=1 Tax=Micromonospora sp. NPDC048999 TaxID=3155391 RepID=UPI0033D06694
MDPDIRGREMRLWQALGPAGYRLRSVGLAALLAVIGVVVFLGSMTVASLLPGSRAGALGPGEQQVRAVVGDCQRVGPISRRGFGYWWECEASVITADGDVRNAWIGPSVVTHEDRGRAVELRESCRDKIHFTDCTYGRPTSRWLGLGMLLIVRLGWLVSLFSGFGVAMFLTRALLGAPRYFRFRGNPPSNKWT